MANENDLNTNSKYITFDLRLKISLKTADYIAEIYNHIKNSDYESAKEVIKESLEDHIKAIGIYAPKVAEGSLEIKSLERTLEIAENSIKKYNDIIDEII